MDIFNLSDQFETTQNTIEMKGKVSLVKNQIEELMCSIMYTTNPSAITHASALIAAGDIVAVPTDTVYGLCCSAKNKEAVQKLFNIKGRNFNKPISLCFSTVSEIEKWADVKDIPYNLINKLLPGPVTLVLRAKKNLHKLLSTKSDVSKQAVLGVRIPENKFIQSLCASLDDPIALTSANVSGKNDSINVDEFKELWPFLACVYDHGTLSNRAPSTVIDLSEPYKYKIIREGAGLDLVRRILCDYNFEVII